MAKIIRLKFVPPPPAKTKPKPLAYISKSGRLTFNARGIQYLRLRGKRHLILGIGEDSHIYVLPVFDRDENTHKLTGSLECAYSIPQNDSIDRRHEVGTKFTLVPRSDIDGDDRTYYRLEPLQ